MAVVVPTLVLPVAVWMASGNYRWSRGVVYCGVGAGMLMLSAGIGWLSQNWHAGFAKYYDRYRHTQIFTELGSQPRRILVLDDRPGR
jgi:hypothetical protein